MLVLVRIGTWSKDHLNSWYTERVADWLQAHAGRLFEANLYETDRVVYINHDTMPVEAPVKLRHVEIISDIFAVATWVDTKKVQSESLRKVLSELWGDEEFQEAQNAFTDWLRDNSER